MVNVAINGNGKVVREAKLPTATRSLEDFFGGLEEPIKTVVECTSNWYWLADWCRANGVDLTLAHAKMVKAISYAKVKTDTVDALVSFHFRVLWGKNDFRPFASIDSSK